MDATKRPAPPPDRPSGRNASGSVMPETDWRDGPAQQPKHPGNLGTGTMKPARPASGVNPDGINDAIPTTNNTRAPGQWGPRS
jgi:hypothetical protein